MPHFWKTRLEHVEATVCALKKGTNRILAETPGKRIVHLLTYGVAEDRRSAANLLLRGQHCAPFVIPEQV